MCEEKVQGKCRSNAQGAANEITIGADTPSSENSVLSQDNAFIRAVREASVMAANKLADYVLCRQQIISTMQQAGTHHEDAIREILVGNRAENFVPTGGNNLWLLDDKFMTYVPVDNEAAQMLTQAFDAGTGHGSLLSDLFLFVSRSYPWPGDVLVIEFRAIGETSEKREHALYEITRNAMTIRHRVHTTGSIWYYMITQFDDKLRELLVIQDYTPLVSSIQKDELFYKYFVNINAHCYFLSPDALLEGANFRNKTLIENLRKSK